MKLSFALLIALFQSLLTFQLIFSVLKCFNTLGQSQFPKGRWTASRCPKLQEHTDLCSPPQDWVSSVLPKAPYSGVQKLKSWAPQIGKRRKAFIHVLKGEMCGHRRKPKDNSQEKYRKVNL